MHTARGRKGFVGSGRLCVLGYGIRAFPVGHLFSAEDFK